MGKHMIERLLHDLEKVFVICFIHGPMFGKIKTNLFLIPAKQTPKRKVDRFPEGSMER